MIYVQNLTKKIGHRILLDNATYHFSENERIALVGSNGCGKTTFLNVLCGLDESDHGAIIKPKSLNIGYLPQEPNLFPLPTLLEECMDGAVKLRDVVQKRDKVLAEMTHSYTDDLYYGYEKLEEAFKSLGGYELEVKAKGYLKGLGFLPSQYDLPPLSLSGGWRMRLELVRVLLNEPNFLILDEPTNHLDLPSLVWLESMLQSFKGTILFVSHDRDLLNRLATVTLHLYQGQLTPYKGNFDAFLEQQALEKEQATAEFANLERRGAQVQGFIDRFRAIPSKAGQVGSRKKMLEHIKEQQNALKINKSSKKIAMSLYEEKCSGKLVLEAKACVIGYEKPVATQINLTLKQGQKVAIIGANGLGKSTLLKSITGKLPLLGGQIILGHNVKVGYFAQNQLDYLNENLSALENVVNANPNLSEGDARHLLGKFKLSHEEVFKALKYFSGGEKSRIGLCCLLAQKPNFLVLDEPTNHLDMQSIEVLAETLSNYQGTVLFVSHDRHFIDSVASHIFVLASANQNALFEGSLSYYKIEAARVGFPYILGF